MKKTKYVNGLLMVSFLVSQAAFGQPPRSWSDLGNDKPDAAEMEKRRMETFTQQWAPQERSQQTAKPPVARQETVSLAPAPAQSPINHVASVCVRPPVHVEKPMKPEDKELTPDDTPKQQEDAPAPKEAPSQKRLPTFIEATILTTVYSAMMAGSFGYVFSITLWPVMQDYGVAFYKQWTALVEAVKSFWTAVGEGCEWVYGALGLAHVWPALNSGGQFTWATIYGWLRQSDVESKSLCQEGVET